MQLQKTIDVENIKPELVAQKCPVCAGFGTVNWGKQTCGGCEGKGWILIPVKIVQGDRRNYGYIR